MALATGGCGSCVDDAGGGSGDPISRADAGGGDGGTRRDDVGHTGDDVGPDPGCERARQCGEPVVCCESGQECVLGQCLEACPGSNRCGADLSLCCPASDVCLDEACVTPGDPCADSFDCPDDAYCEPTLGRCLPQPAGELCEVRPQPGAFHTEVEWHWDGVLSQPQWNKVAMTPVVADIDANGIPDVVFSAYDVTCEGPAVLVAVRGDTGKELFAQTDPSLRVQCSGHLALGNLDEDPQLEIVAVGREENSGIVVFEHDGTLKWRNHEGYLDLYHPHSAPLIADMDADGIPEVVFAGVVLSNTGELLYDHGGLGQNWGPGAMPIGTVADLDGDGALDLVGGGRALKLDGTVIWEEVGADGLDGYPAVADFFGDGLPDVVSVRDGQMRIFEGASGALRFGPVALPGGGKGGPPTVADFDGDGRPEAATAGKGYYTVYDPDCAPNPDVNFCSSMREDGILWSRAVQDRSSSATGSSVFDFEADGKSEVIYNDECFMRVFDGTTGDVLLQIENSSRTATENPVVVDVDGDNNSEIVVPANDDQLARDNCAVGTHGILVYGDPNDKWVRTRRIWNQHAYHVTNVNAQCEIPQTPLDNWQVPGLNNFRQNVQGDGVFNAPDLQVEELSLTAASCSGAPTASLVARIANRGSLGVPAGATIAFFAERDGSRTAIDSVQTTDALLPGEFELLSVQWVVPAAFQSGAFDLVAVVDPDADISECMEDNNERVEASVEVVVEATDLQIEAMSIDDAACGSTGAFEVSVTVRNNGADALPPGVPIVLTAEAGGSEVEAGELVTSRVLPPGDSEAVTGVWEVPDALLNQRVQLRAQIDPEGVVLPCPASSEATADGTCNEIQ